MSKITRSTGIETGLPGWALGGHNPPGGGYSGLTEDLDALVRRAASLLATEYGRDIEIRFNSDRRSGGAWVKDGRSGVGSNTTIGLGGGLRPQRPPTMSMDEFIDKIKTMPVALEVDTYVTEAALSNRALVTSGRRSNGKPYCSMHHASLDAAMVWLRANVRPLGELFHG